MPDAKWTGARVCPAVVLLTALSAVVAQTGDLATFRRQYLGELESKAQQIFKDHPKDPALAAYRQRLELIDRVTSEVIAEFERQRAAELAQVLGTVKVKVAKTQPDEMSGTLTRRIDAGSLR